MSRDRLGFYPFVIVRVSCRRCTRRGSYRLARLGTGWRVTNGGRLAHRLVRQFSDPYFGLSQLRDN